jgi:DNA-binding MarR family transcriptional regulator
MATGEFNKFPTLFSDTLTSCLWFTVAIFLNNILQHPEQLPSMYELEELNPSVSDATVYKHIQKLIDAGIVKEVALDDDQRRQGYPWKFYGLTEEGRGFLEEHNLLAAEETLQQIYDTISDKPEKMVKYENAPRPDDV